ncbi:MAG: GNAT family N-acetyltransferase [Oscillospiraceae bacterium]|nr:GNAT family N-acetyltransferase [Oscillospiraceae bacterium]
MRIDMGQSAMSGAPRENIFVATDNSGQRIGMAAVVEYVNHQLLPDRPLNYYLIIEAFARARDLLFGAAFTRAMMLRRKRPELSARIYASCSPRDPERLMYFTEQGFHNDDAEIVMRDILKSGDWGPKPPVGCRLAFTNLDTPEQSEKLLARVNPYSATQHSLDWLDKARRNTVFASLGVLEEDEILGEIIVAGYGAEGRVLMLYTQPRCRRRGVARALLAGARQYLYEEQCRSVSAQVWLRNAPAAEFFRAAGFQQTGQAVLYPGMDV